MPLGTALSCHESASLEDSGRGNVRPRESFGRVKAAPFGRRTRAPTKALDQQGVSPLPGCRYQPVSNSGNCVSERRGGEQSEENDQSVTQVNSIRPSLSGRFRVIVEPLSVRWISLWPTGHPRAAYGDSHSTINALECGEMAMWWLETEWSEGQAR